MRLANSLPSVLSYTTAFLTASVLGETSHHSQHDLAGPIYVSGNSSGLSEPLPESFVAFSIEFAFFPDFAGNKSAPNTFSDNLLENLGAKQGTKPYIRVGGNTQ